MGINIDSFAGGGGASTGIEAAGYHVDIAINHDPAAIAMHKINHPTSHHYCENIWQVDPVKACGGRHVDFMWASPDCKHFSKASGGALKDRRIRGLAWVVLRWAGTVRPDCIIIENVEEFVTWGPVRKGKPVKARAGETYLKWRGQLERLGYRVESRELVAADYEAPTSRKRFYLIARCDGLPIVWPEPTYGKPDTLQVAAGLLKPWRTAAEIIDWSLPCPSIFATKQEIKAQYGINAQRPLATATMKRIARGTDKFTIKSARPFIVGVNHTSGKTNYDCFRGGDVFEPYSTVTAKNGNGIIEPLLAPYTLTNTTNATGMSADEPLGTVRTGGGCGQILMAPSLIKYHAQDTARGQDLREPLRTLDSSNRFGVSAAFLSEYYGNAQDGISPDEPMRTVTVKEREALTVAHIEKFFSVGNGSAIDEPIGAVMQRDHNALAAAHVVKFRGTNLGQPAAEPLQTLTADGQHYGVVKTRVERYGPGIDLHHWPQVRAMLNEHCGYHLAEDEVLLLHVLGAWYYIADIGLRMITAREAFRAQGFPEDYVIDFEWQGKPFPKSEQMAKAGNSVCPPVAAALVQANHPAAMRKQMAG